MRSFIVIVYNPHMPREEDYHRCIRVSAKNLDDLWEKIKVGPLMCGYHLKRITTEALANYSIKVFELTGPDPIPFNYLERYVEQRRKQDAEEAAENSGRQN